MKVLSPFFYWSSSKALRCTSLQPNYSVSNRGRAWLPFYETHHGKNKVTNKKEGSEISSKVELNYSNSQSFYLKPKISPLQAVLVVKAFVIDTPTVSADNETIFLELQLSVDLSRESVRGVCKLPVGIGNGAKLLVFCPDDDAEEMISAGADFAGITIPLERIAKGRIYFDKCIATTEMMLPIMKVARILGPLKLMPNPKSGTIVANLKEAIQALKSGSLLEYRAEGEGQLKVPIAHTGFKSEDILSNISHFIRELYRRHQNFTGESHSLHRIEFPWPPIKKNDVSRKATMDAQKGYQHRSFIISCNLHAGSEGKVFIDPALVQPYSKGYYR